MSANVYYRNGISGTVELKNLNLNKDDQGYYLSAKYIVDDAYSVRELDIPKIRLPISNLVQVELRDTDWDVRGYVNLGFGNMRLEYGETNGTNAYFSEKILEEKYTEMTLDEIEKKLGHKVKIVSKKEE